MQRQVSSTLLLLLALALPGHAAAWSVQEIGEAVLDPENLHKYRFELLGLACVALYGLAYARGSAAIRKKAKAWVRWGRRVGVWTIWGGEQPLETQ